MIKRERMYKDITLDNRKASLLLEKLIRVAKKC